MIKSGWAINCLRFLFFIFYFISITTSLEYQLHVISSSKIKKKLISHKHTDPFWKYPLGKLLLDDGFNKKFQPF